MGNIDKKKEGSYLMKSYSIGFKIPGAPIAWQRARLSKAGFYDSQKHIKNAINIFLSHYEGPLLEGPHFLTVIFYMPIPKTSSNNKISELKGTFHAIRPDIDNNLKFLLDTCQLGGNIFKDDAIISGVLAFKVWDENKDARTVFSFTPLSKRKLKQEPFNVEAFLDQIST